MPAATSSAYDTNGALFLYFATSLLTCLVIPLSFVFGGNRKYRAPLLLGWLLLGLSFYSAMHADMGEVAQWGKPVLVYTVLTQVKIHGISST